MNIKPGKFSPEERERGFDADDKTVLEITAAELGGATYIELVVDGVSACTVKVKA